MKEIERKYLVDSEKWKAVVKGSGKAIQQGYIFNEDKGVLRVRIKGKKGFITVKSKNEGMTRLEYEYEIPAQEAKELLESMCDNYISKTRYEVFMNEHMWEVDEFHGKLAPLILAEIELNDEQESFQLPNFVTEEVTFDNRYYNSELIKQLS